MLQEWQQKYEDLQQSLNKCYQGKHPFIKTIECCFHKAERLWKHISAQVSGYQFPSIKDEIDFFKRLKPAFTSEIEYYSLVYNAEMFKPDRGRVEQMMFWERELNRFDVFVVKNTTFYIYFKANRTDNDETWFVRGHNTLCNLPVFKVYDMDEKTVTSHDPLVATLIALEKYNKYIAQQIWLTNLNGPGT